MSDKTHEALDEAGGATVTGPTLYERPRMTLSLRIFRVKCAIRRWRWDHFGPWVTIPVIRPEIATETGPGRPNDTGVTHRPDPAPTTAQEGAE